MNILHFDKCNHNGLKRRNMFDKKKQIHNTTNDITGSFMLHTEL